MSSKSNGYCKMIKLFQPSVVFHIETIHLICKVNQMAGLYVKCNT